MAAGLARYRIMTCAFLPPIGPARMTITTSGNIGIGTTNPQGKLDVSGNIVLNGNPRTQLSTNGEVTSNGDVVVVKGRGVEINAAQMVVEYLVSAAIPMIRCFPVWLQLR